MILVTVDAAVRLNAIVPHWLTAVVQVEIAAVPPEALCDEDNATGADALMMFVLVGMLGATGGALPAKNHTSRLADPLRSAMMDHPVIVQAYGIWMNPFSPADGTEPPPSIVIPMLPDDDD